MVDCRDDKNTTKNDEIKKDHPTLGVDNDLRVVISSKEDGVLFDQICCTCINIILNDDGEIATSFMGVHNENILKQLTKAQKAYFKAIKKTLKEERMSAKDKLDEEKNDDNKDKENTVNKSSNNEETSKLISSDTPAYEHDCNKKGKRISKKNISSSTKK
ncbi:MAG: hypothetical protein E7361_04275 [Clostridiales bacterium]|nr:hypothetical protein [Clostridiales bacterium]